MVQLLALLALPAGAVEHPAGSAIGGAALVDVTDAGFDAAVDAMPLLVPDRIDLDPMSDSSGWSCFGYEYSLSGAWVGIEVTGGDITPRPASDGALLDVQVDLLVWVNDASDPFSLYVEALCVGSTCDGHVEPFPVTATMSIALQVVEQPDGTRALDATVGDVTVSYDLTSDHIVLENCALSTVEEVLNVFGLSLYDLVIDAAAGQIDSAVADLGPQIEQALEDAFASASVDEEIDVGDTTIHLRLEPSDVSSEDAGMRVTMEGLAEAAEVDECVAAYDPGYSEGTGAAAPAIGEALPGADAGFHGAALVADDFLDQALYAAWQGGMLCQDTAALDVPLDTSLLASLAGDAFDDLFDEPVPLTIVTRPEAPPVVDPAGAHYVDVLVRDLGIDFYAELDDRDARVLGVLADADVGLDAAFDGTTGELALEVDMGADALEATVVHDEFAPGTEADIETRFGEAMGSLLDTLVGGQLGDLAWTLGSYEGLGLTDLQLGGTEGWLGAFAWFGPVTYGDGGGCGGDGGGCSGGCAATGRPGGRLWALVLLPLLVAATRRRR